MSRALKALSLLSLGLCFAASSSSGSHPTFKVNSQHLTLELSSSDTGGRSSAVRIEAPPGGGPAAHVHSREDETYVVTKGHFRFWRGKDIIDARPGMAVYLPRGIPHQWRNVGGAPGEQVLIMAPAGLERFFMEISRRKLKMPRDRSEVTRLQSEYGIHFVPPLMNVSSAQRH